VAVTIVASVAPLPAAHAAGVEVSGAVLRVSLGGPQSGTGNNGAFVRPLQGGGALVSFHGSVNSGDKTVGPGCQVVANSNGGSMPAGYPAGLQSAEFTATCTLDNVRVLEGRLRNISGSQGWASTLNLPTNVTSTSNATGTAGQGGDKITTGAGGDRITGAAEHDEIDAGGAPYKGQEALPPIGNTELDDPNRNFVNGGAGNDTFSLTSGTGRDVVTGGAGTDLATYASRFGIGTPGAVGVHLSLDGQANDGDPNIDPSDSTAAGEGDNIGTDVENLTGTKRDDRLIGNGVANTLFGDEGVDTLTGNAGEDVILAREPPSAGSGTADVISCGSPAPATIKSSSFGVFIQTATGNDALQADLADPKPADCELLVDMAVDEPAPVKIGRTARRKPRRRLAVRLACPRKAGRTCKGELRLAGEKAGSKPADFSIAGGSRRTVRLKLSRKTARALKRERALARVVSNEAGLKGEVNRVELLRVR